MASTNYTERFAQQQHYDASKAHNGPILSTTWSADGSVVATSSADKTMKLWSIGNGVLKSNRLFKNFSSPVMDVAWSTTQATSAVAAEQGKVVQVLDARSRGKAHKITTPEANLHIAWRADGNYVAVSDISDGISIIDMRKLRILKTSNFDFEVNEIKWNPYFPDSNFLYMSTYQGSSRGGGTVDIMRMADDGSLEYVRSITGHSGVCYCIDFCPGGSKIAVGSYDSIVSIWDLEHLVCTNSIMEAQNNVKSVSFNHNGELLVAATAAEGPLQVNSVKSGEVLGHFACPSTTKSVAFSPKHYQVAFAFEGRRSPRGYPTQELRVVAF